MLGSEAKPDFGGNNLFTLLCYNDLKHIVCIHFKLIVLYYKRSYIGYKTLFFFASARYNRFYTPIIYSAEFR